MKIELGGNENLQEIINTAILSQLTQESREILIKQAIAEIIKPQFAQPYQGKKEERPSMLQEAFTYAINAEVHKQCRELVASDAYLQQKIKELLAEVAHRTFNREENREKLIEKMSAALVEGLALRGY